MTDFDEFMVGTTGAKADDYDNFTTGCNLAAVEIKEWVPDRNLWCLCEVEEGELPKVSAYVNLADLLKAIEEKENQDTFLWVFYGQPLQFTKLTKNSKGKGLRYLMLPGLKAVTINREATLLDSSLLSESVEIENEGWMGDPTFMEAQKYFTKGYKNG